MCKANRSLIKNENGMELPINIVVMLVVGMVALAALLAIIPETKKNLVIEVLSVNDVDGVTGNIDNGESSNVTVDVIVYDSDNNLVEGANVIITGGGGIGSIKTDSTGQATVDVHDVFIRLNQDSIDLELVVKANGFYDYTNEAAILIT
ncbi:MAG: hypothetical protein C5S45_00515 [Candidatus Methanocomedens sp.]|nr:MAG: hypothetical protein C5S45_00515 [ANME-2 cluster archaeon]